MQQYEDTKAGADSTAKPRKQGTADGKKEEKKHDMATKMRRTEAKGRHYETYLGKK